MLLSLTESLADRQPDGGGGGRRDSGDEGVGFEEEYAGVFSCEVLEVSCHITTWFHGLVLGILEPLFGWIAGKLFATSGPTDGVTWVSEGVAATVNALSCSSSRRGSWSWSNTASRRSTGRGRPVVGSVASNVSSNVVAPAAQVSTDIARAITSDGIKADVASHNLTQSTTPFPGGKAFSVVLFLVVFVVLLVLWVIVEIVRIVVILLMVGGPLMLLFHTLPQTNRVAQVWAIGGPGACDGADVDGPGDQQLDAHTAFRGHVLPGEVGRNEAVCQAWPQQPVGTPPERSALHKGTSAPSPARNGPQR